MERRLIIAVVVACGPVRLGVNTYAYVFRVTYVRDKDMSRNADDDSKRSRIARAT